MRSLALMQANSTATTTPQWATPPTTCWCRHSNAQRAAEAVRRAQPSSLTAAASVKRNPSSTAQLAAAAATCLLLACPGPSFAHIAIDQLPQPNQQQQQQSLGEFGVRQQPPAPSLAAGFDPSAVGQIRGPAPSRSSSSISRARAARQQQQSVTATEALEALQQLRTAEALFKQADYAAALAGFTHLVQQHPDLALTEYARLGQALCLYQEGQTSQALTELNELELDIRGNPETHAALAAVLYAERPAQRFRAEQQWDIALEFDERYGDAAWVRDNKHWPPRLMGALESFLSLK